MAGKFDADAFSPGNLMREIRDLKRRLGGLETARRLESSTIGKGGITIKDGGEITALYPGGAIALKLGELTHGNGFKVQTTSGTDLLLAREHPGATYPTQLLSGAATDPVEFIGFVGHFQSSLTCVDGGDVLLYTDGDGGSIFVQPRDTGGFYFDFHTTTSATTPVCILNTNGLLQRSTSSIRYKQEVEDFSVDTGEVMALRPRTWRDRGEVAKDPDAGWHVGLVAEEVAETLPEFVAYNEASEPEAVAYDKLSVALLEVVRSQQAQIEALTARVATLDGQAAPEAKAVKHKRKRMRLPKPLPARRSPMAPHEFGSPRPAAPPPPDAIDVDD